MIARTRIIPWVLLEHIVVTLSERSDSYVSQLRCDGAHNASPLARERRILGAPFDCGDSRDYPSAIAKPREWKHAKCNTDYMLLRNESVRRKCVLREDFSRGGEKRRGLIGKGWGSEIN